MPLLEAHRGYVAADRLPGILRCSHCGGVRIVREGLHRIRSHDPVPIEAQDVARPPRPKLKRTARGKRILVPGELRAQTQDNAA